MSHIHERQSNARNKAKTRTHRHSPWRPPMREYNGEDRELADRLDRLGRRRLREYQPEHHAATRARILVGTGIDPGRELTRDEHGNARAGLAGGQERLEHSLGIHRSDGRAAIDHVEIAAL